MGWKVNGWLTGSTQTRKSWQEAFDTVVHWLVSPETWLEFSSSLIQIIIILILGWFLRKVANRIAERLIRERSKNPYRFNPRRIRTMGKLFTNTLTYLVNFIVIMMILNQVGINLVPLLAGAGVVGLAIGFGAQSLVKDVITGFFIIFEDQFAVGDTVQIGDHKGTVEEIGMRVTRIASWTGEVHIIPNGLITQVTNYSINNTIATVDIQMPYQSDVDRTISLLEHELGHFKEKTTNAIGNPHVLGMQTMSQAEVSLRIAVECRPDKHIEVQRQLLAEVKKILDSRSEAAN